MRNILFCLLSLAILIFTISIILTGNIIEIPHELALSFQRKFISPIDSILDRQIDIKIPDFSEEQKIPKLIFQTHKDRNHIQEDYIENLKKLNIDWEYNFYDDNDCINFLEKNYGLEFVKKFKSFKSGAHKSDLWRLCVLYKYGGCYLDADILLYKKLNSLISEEKFIIPMTDNYLIPTTYNAFIISNPGNPLLKKLISNIMKVEQKDLDKDYCLILRIMNSVLKEENYNYIIKEKLFSFLSVSSKNYYLIDKTKNKIAKSKREDYLK